MPEGISTPNLDALPITSQELGRGAFFAPPPDQTTKRSLSRKYASIKYLEKFKDWIWLTSKLTFD